MKDFLIKNKVLIIIVFLILEGLFLRTFHLVDWLHFQLDQSRDSFLIKEVVQKGIGDLPLLGPRAGGSLLRLGPFYYYLMYLMVLVTRSFHPVVYALPETLASIAFVPLFYLLARRLFNENWSLILTALAVNSTFLITYDRFSWNPNLLPLFSVMIIYIFLRYIESKRKETPKASLKWIALFGLVAGLMVQLHFVAFVALPIVFAGCILVYWLRAKIYDPDLARKYTRNWLKEIPLFLLVFALIQTPVFANEYLSKGTNTKQFFGAVAQKQGKDETHRTIEKLAYNFWVYPKGYFITITCRQGVDFPYVLFRPNPDIKCDARCREYLTSDLAAAIIFFLSAITFLIVFIRTTRKVFSAKVKEQTKRYLLAARWELLLLLLFWIFIPWWAFYSLSFSLRPRFFLISIVPFWLITGIFLREISRNSLGKKLAYLAVAALLVSNVTNTVLRFQTSASAIVVDKGDYPQDQILFQDETYPVTIAQQQAIADWIMKKYRTENKDYLFVWAPSFYYRPILYLLDNWEARDKVRYFSQNPRWANASYFAVTRTTSPKKFFTDARNQLFTVVDKQELGTLTVYQLALTDKGVSMAQAREKTFIASEKFKDPQTVRERCFKKPKASCRFNWGDLFVR